MLTYQSPSEYLQDPPSPVMVTTLWRRLLALLLDVLVLWILGFYLVGLSPRGFHALGHHAWMVGYPIALTYFGILNSHIGKGQTVGKRLMQIRVMNMDGSLVSVPRAVARAVLLVTWSMVDTRDLHRFHSLPVTLVLDTLSIGMKLGAVYFILINRQTRQGLHDLVCDTCVVRGGAGEGIDPPRMRRYHWAVYVVAAISLSSLGICVMERESLPFLRGMAATEKALERLPEVRSSSVSTVLEFEDWKPVGESVNADIVLTRSLPCSCTGPDRTCACATPPRPLRSAGVPLLTLPGIDGSGFGYEPGTLQVSLRAPGKNQAGGQGGPCGYTFPDYPGCPCAVQALADRVAGIVLDRYPLLAGKRKLTVNIRCEIHAGLVTCLTSHPFSQSITPEEWNKRLTAYR